MEWWALEKWTREPHLRLHQHWRGQVWGWESGWGRQGFQEPALQEQEQPRRWQGQGLWQRGLGQRLWQV